MCVCVCVCEDTNLPLTVCFTTGWAVGLQAELWVMDSIRVCYTGP